MSIQTSEANITSIDPWSIANWALTPVSHFFPSLSNYFSSRKVELEQHTSHIIAKKIDVQTPYKVFEGKKIDVIGGKFSYPEAIIIAPKIIEKQELFELTRKIHQLNDNQPLHQTINYIFTAAASILVLYLGSSISLPISLIAVATLWITSIYFARQEEYIYDEKAAQVIGFQLAKESIVQQKQSPLSYFFSPTIDQRLKHLDEAEKAFPDLHSVSLEEFFSDHTKEM